MGNVMPLRDTAGISQPIPIGALASTCKCFSDRAKKDVGLESVPISGTSGSRMISKGDMNANGDGSYRGSTLARVTEGFQGKGCKGNGGSRECCSIAASC